VSGIYDILNSWDLTKTEIDLNIYNKADFKKISDEIESNYFNFSPNQVLGRVHMGITESINYMETDTKLSRLAIPLLCFKQVWLPDPFYSFFSIDSLNVWEKMPDSGSRYFSRTPTIHTKWSNYWGTSKDERIDYLKKRLPVIISKLHSVRQLVEEDAICLYPWELIVNNKFKKMKETVNTLRNHEIFEQISTQLSQDKYNLGPRLGGMGIQLTNDHTFTGLKAGTKLWLGDKTPVLVCGIINTMLTEIFGASFIASLDGDRLIHDFIRSGGFINPNIVSVAESINLPKFSEAMWEDIIAIRKSSETLAIFREIVKDASQVNEEYALDSIKERLEDVIVKIKEDKPLWNTVKGSSTGLVIGALGGFISSAVTGTTLPLSALSGGVGAGVSFLWELYRGFSDTKNSEARKRVDLLTRVKDKI
jgi:hypothetical protein